jgi:hypothetical protein
VLLVYTHHWGWLIVAGHVVAGLWLISRVDRPRLRAAGEWAVAEIAILIAYGFWLRPLLFQIANTGHLPTIHEGRDLIGYFVFAILNLPRMFWATYPPTLLPSILIGTVVAMVVAASARKWIVRQPGGEPNVLLPRVESAVGFLLVGGGVPILIALALSPRSNLLLDRCVVAVVPVFLIVVSIGLFRLQRSVPAAAAALVAFAVAAGFANIVALGASQRSNAREVASILIRDRRPGDVVIVVPEWIAPSFNYYFPASDQQIDFPHPGRSGLLDFAQYRDKMLDTAALERVAGIATATADTGNRVWLVTARRFLTFAEEILPTLPAATHARAISALELDGVRRHLTARHGYPDTTSKADNAVFPRYEELVLMLFDGNNPSVAR